MPAFVGRKTTTAIAYLLGALAYAFLLLLHSQGSLNQPSKIEIAFCVLATLLLGLAAGISPRRPQVGHVCALAGVAGLPWLYTTTLHGNIYTNLWILFNVPDRELRFFEHLAMEKAAIIAAAVIVFAIAIGMLRLLPGRWGQRTWPAVAASLFFLATWFSLSVTPYRIPGAVDYSRWPMLQILHVQKHGLQFHETCIKVWRYRGNPQSSTVVAWNDRRLFEYQFQQESAGVTIPPLLVDRVAALIQSSKTVKTDRDAIKPLRGWDDEGWYVTGEEVPFQAYTKENKLIPPQEVIDLFEEVATLPHTQVTSEDRRDVCLGFCYDQLAALGALYANHRCRYEETSRDYVCR